MPQAPQPNTLFQGRCTARPAVSRLTYSRNQQETAVNPVLHRVLRSLQRNILAGIITVGPLFVTWLIFSFVLGSLAKAGLPLVQLLEAVFPEDWLAHPVMQSILAVVLTLVVLYVLGLV